jgi:hypothetical protein
LIATGATLNGENESGSSGAKPIRPANASIFDVPPAERSQSQSVVTNAEKFELNADAV